MKTFELYVWRYAFAVTFLLETWCNHRWLLIKIWVPRLRSELGTLLLRKNKILTWSWNLNHFSTFSTLSLFISEFFQLLKFVVFSLLLILHVVCVLGDGIKLAYSRFVVKDTSCIFCCSALIKAALGRWMSIFFWSWHLSILKFKLACWNFNLLPKIFGRL